jgi:hypothetical protein
MMGSLLRSYCGLVVTMAVYSAVSGVMAAPVAGVLPAAPGAVPPASAPIAPTPTRDVASDLPPREDPVAAAHMVGTEVAGASAYFLGYGTALSAMSSMYFDSAPGIAGGLGIGGALNLGVGAILLVAGQRRLKATDAWLDARSGRRERFTSKAERRGLYLHHGAIDGSTATVVHRGRKLGLAGFMVIMTGGVLNGLGVGVTPLSRGAGLGLIVGGSSALVVGAVLASRGKKMSFRPHDHVGPRPSVAVAPTLLTSPNGERVPGLSLAGRW